jgi:hypothetical protein
MGVVLIFRGPGAKQKVGGLCPLCSHFLDRWVKSWAVHRWLMMHGIRLSGVGRAVSSVAVLLT